jgi:hypothetical protein
MSSVFLGLVWFGRSLFPLRLVFAKKRRMMVLPPDTMTITTAGEDSMQEWLPRHQGFDPAIVLQKVLQGLCSPQQAVDAVNQIIQQSFPSGTGLSPEEQLLHSEVLRPPNSDELSVDSGIQLGDPEGELSKTDDSAWQGSSSSPNDCISDKKKSYQTPRSRPSAWHILLIIVSILIGLYLSHATVMPHQGGMVVDDNDQHHATPDVVVVTTPSVHHRPEKGGGRSWRKIGRRRPVLYIDDAVRGGGD